MYLSGTNVPLQETGPLCRALWERTAQAAIDFHLANHPQELEVLKLQNKVDQWKDRTERAESKAANLAQSVEKMRLELMSLNSRLEQEQANHEATKVLMAALEESIGTSPWVSVKERKPTMDDSVRLGGCDAVIWTNADFVEIRYYRCSQFNVEPTHWMSIPPLPTKPDPMREEFEAWATFEHSLRKDYFETNQPPYSMPELQNDWKVWQAARKEKP